MPTVRSYGAWTSPITAAAMTGSSVGLTPVGAYRGRACWLESRSAEKGRVVLVAGNGADMPADLTPADHSVRSRVHEYGGGAAAVDGALLVYVNDADQRLYRIDPDGGPVSLTAPSGDKSPPVRYADMSLRPGRQSRVVVRPGGPARRRGTGQRHRPGRARRQRPGRLRRDRSTTRHDFVACAALQPRRHPFAVVARAGTTRDMPWDGTDAVASHRSPRMAPIGRPERVAGGPDGGGVPAGHGRPTALCIYVSDRSGWWNLYRVAPVRWGGRRRAALSGGGRLRTAVVAVRHAQLRFRLPDGTIG